MKKILVLLLSFFILAASMPFFALGASQMPDFVVDEASLLTNEQENALQTRLEKLMKEHKCHFVIVTVDSLGSRTAYSYADSYFHDNGYGYGENDSGILLLLSMEYRDYYIYTYGDAEEKFGDSELTDIEDEMLPHFGKNRFYEGFIAFSDACDDALSFDILGSLLIAVIIGAVVSLIIVFSMKSKLKSIRLQKGAANYVRNGSFTLTRDADIFLYRNVTRTRRQSSSSSSSGRGGGGSRGGGRGGKF